MSDYSKEQILAIAKAQKGIKWCLGVALLLIPMIRVSLETSMGGGQASALPTLVSIGGIVFIISYVVQILIIPIYMWYVGKLASGLGKRAPSLYAIIQLIPLINLLVLLLLLLNANKAIKKNKFEVKNSNKKEIKPATNKLYNVIFSGEIGEKQTIETVKKNFITFFKVDEKRIEHLFSGNSTAIKKGITYDAAMKIKANIHKAGAICEIKAIQN